MIGRRASPPAPSLGHAGSRLARRRSAQLPGGWDSALMRALFRLREPPERESPQHPVQPPKLAGFQVVNRISLKVSKIWRRPGPRQLLPGRHGPLGFVSVRL
jgi:hypothetical protein